MMSWFLPVHMKEFDGGFVNHAALHDNGIVIKSFRELDGVSVNQKIQAEYTALRRVPIAPTFFDQEDNTICMSLVEGEQTLDTQLYSSLATPTILTEEIGYRGGQALASIHNVYRTDLPEGYRDQHFSWIEQQFQLLQSVLERESIDVSKLGLRLVESYDRREMDRQGTVYAHGDYWLNNVIGRIYGNSFTIEGVIDWEKSGIATPYRDYGIVLLNIEQRFPGLSEPFWKGYGAKPVQQSQEHYALLFVLDWIRMGKPDYDFSTSFSQDLLNFLKRNLT